MEIKGRVAVVTGAGSGIGRAIAVALAERGARIVIADINDAGAGTTSALVHEAGSEAVSIHCDVTQPAHIADALALARTHFGSLDIVCNNAGILSAMPLFEDDQDEWVRAVDINLTAVIEGTRQAVRAMQETGGVIINTASMGGFLPMPTAPVYAATKAGVINFTRSLAYLAEESNIRVNAIAPSFVDTPLVRDGGERMLELAEELGGLLEPAEIAAGLIELVEDDTRAGAIMRITVQGGRDYARDVRP